jgi:hypothetical protein
MKTHRFIIDYTTADGRTPWWIVTLLDSSPREDAWELKVEDVPLNPSHAREVERLANGEGK